MSSVYVIGSINIDLVIKTDYVPKNGETVKGRDFFYNPGGKGANQAVASAKQGVKTYLIGNVGNDVFGSNLITSLKMYNVDTEYVGMLNKVSTGVAMITICDNDNRIILDSGANNHQSIDSIDKALMNAKKGDILIAQLECNYDATKYGLKAAHEKGLITIFNPAPAITLEDEIYKYVTHLVVNETECEILTGIYPNNDLKLEEAYKKLNRLGVKNLIVTLGKNGSVFFNETGKTKIKPNRVDAVDSTSAGDTYVGCFAARLIEGDDLKKALEYSSVTSSLTCLKKGAQQSIPTKDEVERYIINNKIKF